MHQELSQDQINLIRYLEDELAKGKYEKMISYFGDLDGKTILDVGCGPGLLIDVLIKQSPTLIVTLDIDVEWLNYANKKYENNENVMLVRANAEHLPFKNCPA
jgi:ubiquinone/menaquinone biosynthesis C-methylase UbiE